MMTNVSIIRSVVVLLAIFVTGLLAGVMLGVAMEQQTAQKLPEAAWTLRRQNDDALFRKVMPITFIAMMLLLIASTFLLHGRSRMAMAAATVCALAVIIVTAGWEVPINNEIVKWNHGNAPADWMSTRDKWLYNHYTIAAGVKSATRNLSDYKRRMALVIRIIAMGANGFEI
jgi:hypothetical protein